MTDTLYLLDTHGVAVWLGKKHEKEQRFTPDGERCELLDAFREWLLEMLGAFEPSHLAACLEGSRNWRKDAALGAVDYKAQRQPFEVGLAAQLSAIPALLESYGVACVRDQTMEADDVIATLAAMHSETLPVVIISSDKDLSQLLGPNVTMFAPVPDKAGERHHYDAAAWEKKSGVPPHRMREFLALLGDASDNVEGIEGWGRVTAITAIAQTKSWPEIVRKARAGQLEKIPTKKQATLIAHLDDFALAYKLVGLRYDAIVPDLESLRFPAEHGNSAEQAETGSSMSAENRVSGPVSAISEAS